MTPEAQSAKENNKKMDFTKIKLFCIKEQYQDSKKAINGTGENIYKSQIY